MAAYDPKDVRPSGAVRLPEDLVVGAAELLHANWLGDMIASGKHYVNVVAQDGGRTFRGWDLLTDNERNSAKERASMALAVYDGIFGIEETLKSPVLPPKTLVVDRVAEGLHDAWVRSRMDDGWSYGEKYDSAAKKSDMLKPFSELFDFEKDWYRADARVVFEKVQEKAWLNRISEDAYLERSQLLRPDDAATVLCAVRAKAAYQTELAKHEVMPEVYAEPKDPYPLMPYDFLVKSLERVVPVFCREFKDEGEENLRLHRFYREDRGELKGRYEVLLDTPNGGNLRMLDLDAHFNVISRSRGVDDAKGTNPARVAFLEEAVNPSGRVPSYKECMDALERSKSIEYYDTVIHDGASPRFELQEMGVKPYIVAHEEVESIKRHLKDLPEAGRMFYSYRMKGYEEYLEHHDVSLFQDIVAKMDFSYLPDDKRFELIGRMDGRNQYAVDLSQREFAVYKGKDLGDKEAMWNSDDFVGLYCRNAYKLGVNLNDIRIEVASHVSYEALRNYDLRSFLALQANNAKEGLVERFKLGVDDGTVTMVLHHFERKESTVTSLRENAEKVASMLGDEKDVLDSSKVKMNREVLDTYMDMFHGIKGAMENFGLPKYLRDAGIFVKGDPSSQSLSAVVWKAAEKMCGDCSEDRLAVRDGFLKRNHDYIAEGRKASRGVLESRTMEGRSLQPKRNKGVSM